MAKAKWSPEAETIKALQAVGMVAEKTTWMIPYKFIKKDLFGFSDVIAFDPKEGGTLLIQATTLHNLSARCDKVRASDKARQWLGSPHREIQVWGWREDDCGDLFASTIRIVVDGIEGQALAEEVLGEVQGVPR